MSNWAYAADFIVVGSGGGLGGALAAADGGADVLVVEKENFVGGSTGISGGVVWLPNNPVMKRDGVPDSVKEGMQYFASVVGDVGPASSIERRRMYIEAGSEAIGFLEGLGLEFNRPEGYMDYYSEAPGGQPRGRSIEPRFFDSKKLGPWRAHLREGLRGVAIYTGEARQLALARRSARAFLVAVRVAARTFIGRLLRQCRVTNGSALTARLLHATLEKNIRVWVNTPMVDLIVEEDEVRGVVVRRNGEDVAVRARLGVLLSAGGFARNPLLRRKHLPQPNEAAWTSSSMGDTGDALEIVLRHFAAATDLLDEAWWMPSFMPPSGTPQMCVQERCKPGSVIVDTAGRRFMNEAAPYMEAGQLMYAQTGGSSVPNWLIIDSRHRKRYPFGFAPPGVTPGDWISSGYMKRADSLAELAEACGIGPDLEDSIARINSFAAEGKDRDFGRGDFLYGRYYGDPRNRPNPCLGPIDEPPYYAVAIYPGDVGTSGGLLCDEFSRVLATSGVPIPGLYASGNTTASVMGRRYLGPGASIGASLIFSYVAGRHATGSFTGDQER